MLCALLLYGAVYIVTCEAEWRGPEAPRAVITRTMPTAPDFNRKPNIRYGRSKASS